MEIKWRKNKFPKHIYVKNYSSCKGLNKRVSLMRLSVLFLYNGCARYFYDEDYKMRRLKDLT